jgi:hypothetical protein
VPVVFVPDVPVPVEPEVLVPEDEVPDEPEVDVPAGDVPDGAVLQLVQQPCSWLALPLLPMAPLEDAPIDELPLMEVPPLLPFKSVELHAASPSAARPPMRMP